jgi:outer membrane protein TolC
MPAHRAAGEAMKKLPIAVLFFCLTCSPAQAAAKTIDLQEAQRIALQGNPSIGAAQARIEQAKAKVRQAEAAWQPSVDAIGSFGLSYKVDSGAVSDSTGKNSQIGLQASWLLFDGYARKFQELQAKHSESASVEGKLDSQRLLLSSVADAFFNAQLAKTSIDIADADQKFYEQQLADAQHRFDAGAGSWGDVLNIKVQVNAAKNSVLTGQRDYSAARSGLAALLGLEDADLPGLAELDNSCGPAVQKNAEILISQAVRQRPDYQKLTMQIKAAEAAARLAETDDAPKVKVQGQLGGSSQDKLFPETDDLGSTLTLSMSWNLYSGGAVEAAAVAARQAKREAIYSRAALRNSIAAEVRQDLTKLAAAREQVQLQKDTVALVEENRKLAKSEYEAGAASLTRLNEAQRDLTATHGRLAQAVVACHQAENQLLAAVGGNLEPFSKELLEAKVKEPREE